MPRLFENMNCAHHVGGKGFDWVDWRPVGGDLRRVVNDDFRLEIGEGVSECLTIAKIAEIGSHAAVEKGSIEETRPRRRRRAITGNLGSQQLQPCRHPPAGEPGVAGDENSFSPIKVGEGLRH